MEQKSHHGHHAQQAQHAHKRVLTSITVAAIMVAASLVLIKFIAWRMTDSVALLGSLLDSLLDLMISAVNFFVVRHALLPADHEHRFGHGKAEALGAMAQGGIILLSVGFLLWESGARFIAPAEIQHGLVGIMVMVISIVMTSALVIAQNRVARQTGSLAIQADSTHYRGDVVVNIGIIIALVLATYAGLNWADPFLGVIVALILAESARKIISAAGNQLMDRELSESERAHIRDIILRHPEVRGVHDLRTRQAGTQKFIQCHIELDGDLKLMRAHHIADEVEADIIRTFPEAEIIIHQDPEGYECISSLEKS